MKTRLLTLICTVAISASGVSYTRGADNKQTYSRTDSDAGVAVVADTLVARPLCLATTVVGSAIFIISLPVAAASKSVKQTAHTLVVRPAKATFTRPLGDFSGIDD